MRFRIRRRTALGVAGVTAAQAALIACGGGTKQETSSSSGTQAPAGAVSSEPVKPKVDRLVMALPPPSAEGNDPGRDYSSPGDFQVRPMYEHLIAVDAKTGKFLPMLATEWKAEPDGKSYRFKLRQGIPFHNGMGEFTAKDVVHTHWNISQPDTLHGNGPWFRDIVEKIDVINDYELVFRLARPDAEFLNNVSELVGGFEIQSKADFDKRGKPSLTDPAIAGTGPYQFDSRAQGQYVRFKRVQDKHWRITPDFPELELRWQREASTRLAALLAGEVHVTALPKDVQKEAVAKGNKVIGSQVPGLRTFLSFLGGYLADIKDPSKGFLYPDSPMNDVRVRRALNKAVNRDELNKAFFDGKGEPMVLNHFHPQREGWNPDWEKRFPEQYGYDPNKARALLAEAGYNQSKPLRLTIEMAKLLDVPESEDVLEAAAGYWRAIGVDVKLETLDENQRSVRRRELKFDNHSEMRATSSHLLTGYRVYSTSLHGLRGSAVERAETNDAYRKCETELDDEKRGPLWREAGNRYFDLVGDVPLFWLPAEATVNSKIVNDYLFPGNISGVWTHLWNITAAR
jgi:ABC-type transport system substrate-binding protein